jgi:hypothetical protein
LSIFDCRFVIADCRLLTVDCRFSIADCEPGGDDRGSPALRTMREAPWSVRQLTDSTPLWNDAEDEGQSGVEPPHSKALRANVCMITTASARFGKAK